MSPDSGEQASIFDVDQLIGNRYRILRLLARSETGEIYQARDLELETTIALKAFRIGNTGSERILELFRHRMQIARKATHPNVRRLFDVFQQEIPGRGRIVFLSMELLEGLPLSYRLNSGGLPPQEAVSLHAQVLQGLAALHAAGLPDWEPEPENVMVVSDSGKNRLRAVLTGFGIEQALGQRSSSRSALEVLQSLATAPARLRGGAPRILALVGLLALGLLGLGLWRHFGRFERTSVAILKFRDSHPSGKDWISLALTELLDSELMQGEGLRVVSGESVAQAQAQVGLSLEPAILAHLRELLGADWLVLGEYQVEGDRLEIQARLWNGQAETESSVLHGNGVEGALFGMVSELASQLTRQLHASQHESARQAHSLPSDLDAMRLYAQGLDQLRLFKPLEARELLEKAVAAAPDSPLFHIALARAWEILGYDKKALDSATKAFSLAERLGREERLGVEGTYYRISRKWDQAIECYSTLWVIFPDNLEYGLELAKLQNQATQPQAALETVAKMKQMAWPRNEDPRIDYQESLAAYAQGDFEQSKDAALRALDKSKSRGMNLMAATMGIRLATTLTRLGKVDEALRYLNESQDYAGKAGDLWTQAQALQGIGNTLADKGELAGAWEATQKFLAICRQIGNRKGEGGALNNLATFLADEGRLAEALSMFEESVSLKREVDDRLGIIRGLNNEARIRLRQGKLPEAETLYGEALGQARSSGDKNAAVTSLLGLGLLQMQRLDLAAARKNMEEALALSTPTGNRPHMAEIDLALGQLAEASGDLETARQKVEESLQIRQETENQLGIAQSQLEGARIDLGRGDLASAVSLAQASIAMASRVGAVSVEMQARLTLALVHKKQGQAQTASDEFLEASKRADKVEDFEVRLWLRWMESKLRGTSIPEEFKNLSPEAPRWMERMAAHLMQ